MMIHQLLTWARYGERTAHNLATKDSVKNKLSFWRPDLRQIRASRFRKTADVVVLH